ncbi:hypothetical protein HPP92_020827 [Vanilla planifolia]|uniref:SOSEKI DIX-like domain-containing protein n=1 Tax=Vanilla planifolia TaxID=51239 RepID=A0A835PXP1_VANPL|nr:hypothetical protein HPP92_020827 [Vanilla planifolia]
MALNEAFSSEGPPQFDVIHSYRRIPWEMEGSSRRHRVQVSPERFMVWTEPSTKRKMQCRRVTVVYFLCKNSNFEHPHIIEVPISSPEGLYLRDVINRLVILRGNYMRKTYSWSFKRSYRNGFVWQDLAEDDLILPVQGTEYILKGSVIDRVATEMLHGSNNYLKSMKNPVLHQLQQFICSGAEQASSLFPVTAMRESKPLSAPTPPHSLGDDQSLHFQRRSEVAVGVIRSGEFKVCKLSGDLDASTNDEDGGQKIAQESGARTTHVSAGGVPDFKLNGVQNKTEQPIDFIQEEVSPTPIDCAAHKVGRIDTLASLIHAEVCMLDRCGITKDGLAMSKAKTKRKNAFFQLITCSSIM